MQQGNQWKSVGIAIASLLILGMFDKTRMLAIWIAIILSVIMISKKVYGK